MQAVADVQLPQVEEQARVNRNRLPLQIRLESGYIPVGH